MHGVEVSDANRKVCEWCKTPFFRRQRNEETGSRGETKWEWGRKSCCTRSCSAKLRNSKQDFVAKLHEARKAWFARDENARKARDQALRNLAKVKHHTVTQRFLGWCPEEYREEYRILTRHKHIPVAEARRMIEEMIFRDARAAIDAAHREAVAKHERQIADAY